MRKNVSQYIKEGEKTWIMKEMYFTIPFLPKYKER